MDLTSSPHAQTGPGDEQPQKACSVLLLSDSEDDQQPDDRAFATKDVGESGKGDRPASLGSPDDVLLKPLTISSQPRNGHGPGAVRSGRATGAAPRNLREEFKDTCFAHIVYIAIMLPLMSKPFMVAGRQPLGVSTLAENAAPQKLGDVGGHCAASGLPDRYALATTGLSVSLQLS